MLTAESVISYNTWPEADKKRPKLKVLPRHRLQRQRSAGCTLLNG